MSDLKLRPITFAQAREFIARHHRHNPKVVGWKFGVGVERSGELVGVAVAGRPVARRLDDGRTIEVTRVCTDGSPHACSMLYAAVWRAAKALGYERGVTYTNDDEPGTCPRAAGWRKTTATPGRSWSVPSRPRDDKHALGARWRWEIP